MIRLWIFDIWRFNLNKCGILSKEVLRVSKINPQVQKLQRIYQIKLESEIFILIRKFNPCFDQKFGKFAFKSKDFTVLPFLTMIIQKFVKIRIMVQKFSNFNRSSTIKLWRYDKIFRSIWTVIQKLWLKFRDCFRFWTDW